MNKILIVTDAWRPQVSGVVTTVEKYYYYIGKSNSIFVINPNNFKWHIPCPSYNDIKLSIPSYSIIEKTLEYPDHIHILTEGPIGILTAHICNKMGYKYTTSLLTRFDQYIGMRIPYTEKFITYCMKNFHSKAQRTFISTNILKKELESKGFKNLYIVEKGVDTELFDIRPKQIKRKYPTMLYVGRVSKEKNIDAFLSLKIDGQKVIVGDGPSLEDYKKKYSDVIFTGVLKGDNLAKEYSSADVFVFPSKSETFGLVLTESMASGTPVAALPSDSSSTIIKPGINGYIDNNLSEAIKKCLTIDRDSCRMSVLQYSWEKSTDMFIKGLVNK
jgi:glycosyltransferase involved in cell wall biosynthesis